MKKDKKAVINRINKEGIADILCTTTKMDNDILSLCVEIRTKTGDSYHFSQDVCMKPVFGDMEVLYFDHSGNGKTIAHLGTGFNPKTYPYRKEDKPDDQKEEPGRAEA